MAQYQIKFSCGHTEIINLNGPYKDRQKRIEYLEQYGDCTGCQLKKQKEKEDKKAEESGIEIVERPSFMPEGKWNGIIYASSIYVGGEKIKLDEIQQKEMKVYSDYLEALKRI